MSLSLPSALNADSIIAEIGQIYSLNLTFYNGMLFNITISIFTFLVILMFNLEVGLPSIRVGQCLAFSNKDKLEVVELTDMVTSNMFLFD